MLTIKLEGLDEARAKLAAFSERRFNATIATALTRTAAEVKQRIRNELPAVFDRPTPYTLNSLFMRPATAQRLEARVWVKDDLAGSGTPATTYLLPNVLGGQRREKRLEVAMRAIGALPAGWRVVPGEGARLDAYGNVSKGQIIEVLSQLRITLTAGHDRAMSRDARKAIRAQKRAGGRFFVKTGRAGQLEPGVYQREFVGNNITPVFIFVKAPTYRPRFDFDGIAQRVVDERLGPNIGRAVSEQLARAREK